MSEHTIKHSKRFTSRKHSKALRDIYKIFTELITNSDESYNRLKKKGINTDYSIGLAASVKFEVSEKYIALEITIPSRRLSDSIKVDVSSTSYLGVSILDNEIDYQFSDEEFIYF